MTPIDKRKAELREYIEARARATQGEWGKGCIQEKHETTSNLGDFQAVYHACGPKIEFTSNEGYDKVIADADFISKAANESTLIAEQLLECIVFIEMLQCEYYYSIDGKMQRHFDDCKRCKILNKIAGEK